MNEIIVNGKSIKFDGNIVIKIKRDTMLDIEKKHNISDKKVTVFEIQGNIGHLECDNSNFIINGNVKKLITNGGNVTCNNIKGKVVCGNLISNNMKGDIISTSIITSKIEKSKITAEKIIDNFKKVTSSKSLKRGLTVYHIKYGKGKISSIYGYKNNVMYIDFENSKYSKIFYIDEIIKNGEISLTPNKLIEKEFLLEKKLT